jgi:ParB/RepB/Spo0J family partition protein
MPKPKIDNYAFIQQKLATAAREEVSIFPQGGAPVSPASEPDMQHVPPRYLLDNPYQTRANYEEIESLAKKMKAQGFVGAVLARKAPNQPGYYQLAFGHRRKRAAEMAGKVVRVEVRDLTDQDMILHAASENLEREDLTDLEKGRMFLQMNREFRMTQEDIAAFVGEETKKDIKRGYVRDRMELAELAEEQKEVRLYLERHPQTSIRAMRHLGGLEEPHIGYLLNGMQHYGWTGEQVEQRAKVLREGGAAAAALLSPGEDEAPTLPSPSIGSTPAGSIPEPSGPLGAPLGEAIQPSDKVSKQMDHSLLLSGLVKRVRRYSNAPVTDPLSEKDLRELREITTAMVVVLAARSTAEQKRAALGEIADLIQELLNQTEIASP